uniref:Peptidase S8 pro-domain domain-containing protein n=1 Tax=Glossina pallidipes TaxID=7398 RepID=A0A1B0A3A8_GLOPL
MNLRFNGHNDDECDNSISSQNALHSVSATVGSTGNNGISSTLPQQTQMKIKTSLTSLSATIANSCYLVSVSPRISDSGTCLIKKSYKRKSQKWYACDQVSGRQHLLNSTIDCESLQNVVKYTRINSKNFCTYFLVTLVILSCCPLASVLAILHNNNYDGISQPVNALEREYEKTAKATTDANTATITSTSNTTPTTAATATTNTTTTTIATNRSTTIKAIHNNTNATTISQSVNNNEAKRNGSTNSSSKNSSSVSSNYSNNDQHISNNIWNGLNTNNTGISRTSKNITTAVKLILNDYSEAFSQIINEEVELLQQQQPHEPSFHNNITRRKTNNNNKSKKNENSNVNHNNKSSSSSETSNYSSGNSIKFGTDTGNLQNSQSNVSKNYDAGDEFNLHDELLDSFCSSHSLPHKPYYTNEFAVHIPAGHDMANIIAQKYGFTNMGQLKPSLTRCSSNISKDQALAP